MEEEPGPAIHSTPPLKPEPGFIAWWMVSNLGTAPGLEVTAATRTPFSRGPPRGRPSAAVALTGRPGLAEGRPLATEPVFSLKFMPFS